MMMVCINDEAHAILLKYRETTGVSMGVAASNAIKDSLKSKVQLRGRPRKNKKEKGDGE